MKPRLDPQMVQVAYVCLAAVVMFGSWQFGYRPMARANVLDHAKVKVLTENIEGLESTIEATDEVGKWVIDAQQKLNRLKRRFPPHSQIPQLLDALIAVVKSEDVKLLDVARDDVEPVQDGGDVVEIDGVACYQLPVTLVVEGRYHSVVNMVDRLTSETFPSLVSIDYVNVHRGIASGVMLEATLRLYLYVLGAPARPTVPDARS